ncbi:MAG TPA: LacI family transcriptional regulator [Bacteroidetes bacterium]|nr:LacI family transcriptional regulator [Bacteroidota bacterium]
MAPRPTIRDVAKMAKVAPSTVSAVLNDKGPVHPRTRARIRRAIQTLNFTPRRSARDLASGTSGNIGFLLSEQFFSRTEPFYTRVFLGAEFEARTHDLYVLLTTVERRYRGPHDLPRFLHEKNVDGVIVAGRVPPNLLRDLKEVRVPVVLVDYGDPEFPCPRVLMDNTAGTALAVKHLVELGHRDIGFIAAESDHPSVKERIAGYHQGMHLAGLVPDPDCMRIEETEMSVETGERAFENLCQGRGRPTALVCSNDAMAIGVIRAAKRAGVKVPDRLSVVGFDDVTEGRLHDPPLTTVRVNKEDLGALAVQTLVDRLHNGRERSFEIRVAVELLVRASTAGVNRTLPARGK